MVAPVFFVGMPRSGTTITFDVVASHPDVAWLANYATLLPGRPSVHLPRRLARRGLGKSVADRLPVRGEGLGRLVMRPTEGYPFWARWAHPDFARSYLDGEKVGKARAAEAYRAVQRVVRWQGGGRFACKTTGPGRLAYLRQIFPDALFVHLVRDGRAVVRSLLEVPFWREGGGYERPWWQGWPAVHDDAIRTAATPEALAAAQWVAVVDSIRRDGASDPRNYLEIRYEDFTADPAAVVGPLLSRMGLSPSAEVDRFLAERVAVRSQNHKFRQMDPAMVDRIEAVAAPLLGELGYL